MNMLADGYHVYPRCLVSRLQMGFHFLLRLWPSHESVGRDVMWSQSVLSFQSKTRDSLPLKDLRISSVADPPDLNALVNDELLDAVLSPVADPPDLRSCKVFPSAQVSQHGLLVAVPSPDIASNLKVLALFPSVSVRWWPKVEFGSLGAIEKLYLKVLHSDRFGLTERLRFERIGPVGKKNAWREEFNLLHSAGNRANTTAVPRLQDKAQGLRRSAWREG
ncbi:hypothetical protein CEK25_009101 [Fusarium fujikuroi]|nr:hypothetical protein CEK25_009101 [Fusarium fujikuroi]